MKKYMKIFLLLWCLGASLSLIAASQTEDEISFFNAATKAYNEANYKLAIDYYEKILEDGYHSAAIYYNMGNAYYKQNKIGQSIYYFEKALLLEPTDTEVLKNLGFAQKMTIDAIPTKEENGLGRTYEQFISQYSLHFWSLLAIGTMLLGVFSYLFYYVARDPKQKRVGFSLSLLLLIISVLSYTNGFFLEASQSEDNPAIIFETAKVLSEPNNLGIQIFELHEGTKVQVLESFESWKKVQISDGQKGWLKEKQLKLLKD
ncbi:MAG: tetratricopeptide (TPR) repeat protein [Arcticibacterium sp.]|jgi:tetratricopeptide (TPR) repeat protein